MTAPDAAAGGVMARHQRELDGGRLVIQHCAGCGRFVYYPRETCPHCGGSAFDWKTPSGLGTVYATTTVRRKPADGGDLNVSLIDLDEGVRLMSRVDNVAPDDVRIGQRVTARVRVQDGRGLVLFHTVDEDGA